ncbi:MAG: Hydroxymethylbutenyl pyrophosphate reductase [Candidatus Shapirobacteria bacterium GW2011_GWE2_38_30]|uniref:Hydroxymethylbutenyl pyrophosphate reductase n=1 Tax=Candidatus Shapirobacteria bacterium GW2011_GWE2_38_30 TaxID=1618490 RepID=A0A0G0M5Z0_9BACT|nr:MAG: Hydroxymethylbutenyl pyrophosphate reductase [Candidatus Shapirobacteria bacterium GW2011_GWE2_38_30]
MGFFYFCRAELNMAKKEKVVKNKKKEILTMEDLLKSEGVELVGFKKGQEVRGKITSIKNKAIYIDVGGKSDAVVGGKEFEFVKDYVADLKVGDEIEVQIKSPENDKGQILVSIRGAASGYGWNYFTDKQKNEGEVTVFAKELNRGGAVVVAPFGFYGFVPGSQIGEKYDGDPEKMLGKKVKVKVLEVDQEKNRLVFSERLVSEPGKVGKESDAIDALKVDTVFEAEIVRVEPFGIFVKIDYKYKEQELSLEGLVHISEISWEKVDNLTQMYKAKEKIQVKLINKDEGRLQFSIKRMSNDPWQDISDKYPKEKEVSGVVVRIANFGALVKLEAGVEGLVHVSKLVNGVNLKENEEVDVYIESIDTAKRKISLGLVESDKSKVIYK